LQKNNPPKYIEMKSSKIFYNLAALLILAFALGVSGCKKDKDTPDLPPPVANDPEVLTTLTLTFTDSAGVEPLISTTFRDPDGDGGNGPDIFEDINLSPSTTYLMEITLLNETVTPAEDLSVEVRSEDDEHIFCFTPDGTADVGIARTDSDGTFEVGLSSKWTTGSASTGNVRVVLKHQPDGLKDGTCTPGETDIDVNFAITIQ
jgi:hypothetical protein